MSVKSCTRVNCENIMCETYVPMIGYVCDECQEEFKLNYPRYIDNESTIRANLEEFIETRKRDSIDWEEPQKSVDDFFKYYSQ